MTTQGQTTARTSVRGVLFDMDGVLIDSTGADEEAWRKWAVFHGMQGSFSIQSTHGRRAIDSITALRPDLDSLVETRRLEAFDAEAADGNAILPGVQKLLGELFASQWSIVTSASGPLMRRRLKSVGIAVPPTVVTADDVSRGKPDAEPYRTAAAWLGFAPGDCLVVEDAPNGILAGRRAGCKVLGVTGSHNAAQLREATWIVDSLERVRMVAAADGWLSFEFETVSG
jgi:sugar-phosphatase